MSLDSTDAVLAFAHKNAKSQLLVIILQLYLFFHYKHCLLQFCFQILLDQLY